MSTCSSITVQSLSGLKVSQFLDRNDQFAKTWEHVRKVRLVYEDGRTVDLSRAEYSSLPVALKTIIKGTDSIAT